MLRRRACENSLLKHWGEVGFHADALANADSGSIEAMVRGRKMVFVGFMARMGEAHLPRRVVFG